MILSSSAAFQACSRIGKLATRAPCSTSICRRPALSLATCSGAHNDGAQQATWPRTPYVTRAASSPSAAVSTAQLIKQLRELTGAPMMECKKALANEEVQNDLEKAQEWLRKYGSAKASSKVAGREALEGLVGIHMDGGVASLVKVASETDFASRSPVFSSFVQDVADAAAASTSDGNQAPIDIPSFLATAQNKDGKALSESLNDAILSIRENIQVDSITVMKPSSPASILAGYVHGRAPGSTCGTAAAVVEIASVTSSLSEEERKKLGQVAKNLAMHVVAARPLYLNPETVPEDVVAKEKEILSEKMRDTKKPPEIVEKIITGQLRKFYEGVCLTEQSHMVEEDNPKISKALQKYGLEVKNFCLVGMS